MSAPAADPGLAVATAGQGPQPRVRPSFTLGYVTVALAALVVAFTPDMLVVGVAALLATGLFWALHGSRGQGALGILGIGCAGLSAVVGGAYWPALGAVAAGLMVALALLALGERETRYAVQGLFVLSLAMVVVLIEQTSLVIFVIGVWALAALTMTTLTDESVAGRGTALRNLLRWQGPRLAVVAVPVLLLGLAASLLMPVSDGPRRNFGGAAAGGAGGSRSAAPYLGAGPMDLSMRGQLPQTPIATVPGDSPPLWRMSALSRYDGQRWWPARGSRGQQGEPTSLDTEWEVHPEPGFDFVMAPGVPSGLRSAGLPREGGYPRPYRVRTGPYAPVDSSGTGIPGTGTDSPASGAWTQLPPSVTGRTRALARQVTGGTTDPEQAARLIAAHLTSGQYRYDLDAPAAARGRDSVDHFLFESQAGFCEHYASAEVVMLRSLGIPARVATGFRNGSPTEDGERLIRGRDAHAWVEVHVEGRGWVTVDPTPAGSSGGFSLSSLLLRYQSLIGWVALAAAPLVAVGIVLARRAARTGRRRREADARARTQAADDLVRAVQRLRRELAGGMHPGSTLSDLAVRAPEVQFALAVAEKHVYSAHTTPAAELRAAVEALDAYTAELLAARRREAPVNA